MTRIIFVHPDASTTEIDAENGLSLMAAAVNNGISEIVAECGGACACGTCHCYINSQDALRLKAPADLEQAMIDCLVDPDERSRLSCQIIVDESLDGLVVHLPATQY